MVGIYRRNRYLVLVVEVVMNKIRIPNERLREISQSGENIDQWLIDHVGLGYWMEYIGLTSLPYRSFAFYKEQDAVMFALRWS